MTHPEGRPYTLAERRAIVAAARANARELLRRLEMLALMDGVADVAVEGTPDAGRGGGADGAGAAGDVLRGG